MDEEFDESVHSWTEPSIPSSSRPAVGLGIHPPMPSSSLPDPSQTYSREANAHRHRLQNHQRSSPPAPDVSFGSSAPDRQEIMDEDEDDDDEEDDDEEEDEDDDEKDEDEDGDGMSETSSAMYDPSADPEGFARRLDELAGVLEMSGAEAKALREGPIIGKGKKAPTLPLSDFKNYLNHYLTSTEWQYAPPPHVETLLHRQGVQEVYDPGEDLGQLHPIRALGRSWVGRQAGEDGSEMMAGLGLAEGLPRTHGMGRVVEGLMR